MRLPCRALFRPTTSLTTSLSASAGGARPRRLAPPLLLVTALAVALLPLAPGGAAAEEPVTLAGAVRITASTTGKVPVVVPGDATLDLPDGVRVEGEGRFTGVVLTEPGTADGLVLRSLRSPEQGGARPLDTELQLAARDRADGAVTCTGTCPLPAGRYDLYVVADGAPVQVELDLRGLAGGVEVRGDEVAPVPTLQYDGEPFGGSTIGPWGSMSSNGDTLPMPFGGMAIAQAGVAITTRTAATGWADVCVRVDAGSCAPLVRAHLTATALAPARARLVGLLAVSPGSAWAEGGVWFATAADFSLRYDLDVLLIGW